MSQCRVSSWFTCARVKSLGWLLRCFRDSLFCLLTPTWTLTVLVFISLPFLYPLGCFKIPKYLVCSLLLIGCCQAFAQPPEALQLCQGSPAHFPSLLSSWPSQSFCLYCPALIPSSQTAPPMYSGTTLLSFLRSSPQMLVSDESNCIEFCDRIKAHVCTSV